MGRSGGTRRSFESLARRRSGTASSLLLLALALIPCGARCGPPFQTDDPAVVAVGHTELLGFYQSSLTATSRTGTLPGLEVHLGPLEGVELDLITPLTFATTSGQGMQRGYGDTTFGVKYLLIRESETSPLLSLVPKLVLPTGNSNRGLGNGGSQILLAVAAQKAWGDFQTYGNAGYWINNGPLNLNYWFVGWEAQYRFSPSWILGAEVFHTTAQVAGQPPSTGFNVGGVYFLDPRNQLLFSAGRGLQNVSATNRVSTYLGYQISF